MKNKKLLIIIAIIVSVIIIGSAGTYAWYVWSSTDNDLVTHIDTSVGSAKVYFDAGANITGRGIRPVSDKSLGIVKDIVVETKDINNISFNLYLDINTLDDELKDETFKYALYDEEDNEVAVGNFSDYTTSPCTKNNTNHIVLIPNKTIDNTTIHYTLYIWIDGTVVNNPDMAGKNYDFTLHADGQNALIYNKTLVSASVDGLYEGYSCNSSTSDCTLSFLGSEVNREEITSITFVNNNNVPEEALGRADVSSAEDNSIMLWYTKDTEKSTDTNNYYDVYIGAKDGTVYINDGSYLFYGLTNVESINFGDVVDTTPMTSMYNMFTLCSDLTTLDLSGFDTSNVTNMRGVFQQCSNLTNLDISNFDTSNVTTMRTMFAVCTSLESLDLSKWDVSNVTNMYGVFMSTESYGAMKLKSVGDLSNWDTSKVTDMTAMFQHCIKLEILDLSNFDTSNVTTMSWMFYGCNDLTKLDVSNFDTSNVTSMRAMLSGCKSLTELNINNFDTSNVTDMNNMFYYCDSLTELNLSNFDTSNVTNMMGMFAYCDSLEELDLSGFDTSSVTIMEGMFGSCDALKTVYVSDSWTVASVTNSTEMFFGCAALLGGSGTTYDSNYIDKTYARVDGGTTNPGYFTYKSSNDSNIITFIVNDVEHQAEKGMTWEEWVESDYNINGTYIYGSNQVMYCGINFGSRKCGTTYYSSGTEEYINPQDVIIDGHAYYVNYAAGED